MVVNPPNITLSTPNLNATIGENYFQIIFASGGTPNYTYSIIDGNLPGNQFL
jgi:hypothetical protein